MNKSLITNFFLKKASLKALILSGLSEAVTRSHKTTKFERNSQHNSLLMAL